VDSMHLNKVKHHKLKLLDKRLFRETQPLTTSHGWFSRDGWESHNGKTNNNKGSPRFQPPDHIHTL
jgi:hypothetical protein